MLSEWVGGSILAELEVSLFGGFTCREANGRFVSFPTRKARAVWAFLALGNTPTRDKLARMLWPESSEDRARLNLRKTLSRIRTALPVALPECLGSDTQCVSLVTEDIWVDAQCFEEFVEKRTPEALEAAATLYQGDFLDAFPSCSADFDEWVLGERRRFEELALEVLTRLLEHYVVVGAVERGIQVALQMIVIDALQEHAHRSLIRLYLYQERFGAALNQLKACEDILRDELGIEPGPELKALQMELLRQCPDAETHPIAVETDMLPESPRTIEIGRQSRERQREAIAERISITVLPFTLPGGRERHAHLAEGVTQDIITELGRFRELDVFSPFTTFSYRDTNSPVEQIAAELGARYVLQGSLRPLAKAFRINACLLEARNSRVLWADNYDCRPAEVFGVQDEIVRQIVIATVGQLTEARLSEHRLKAPVEWQAYDHWLRGQSALRRVDIKSIFDARRHFQKALEVDPNYARAYVGLAMAHLSEWACYSWSHWVFKRDEVLENCRRAVELDGRDEHAYCILGMAELYNQQFDSAYHQLTHALELNPNDTDVLAHVSFAMGLMGHHDIAVRIGRNTLRLAPHHPDWYAGFVGIALFSARLPEEAIEVMSLAPQAICDTPAFLAAAYGHIGNPAEAKRHAATVYRHYERYCSNQDKSCVDWLVSLNPFRLASDSDYFRSGLRKAGFS